MPDETTVKVGEVITRVTDPRHILPVSCDIVVEQRIIGETLFLTLGSHLLDGDGPPEVRVVARLRLSLAVAEGIYQTTQRTLDAARKAADEAKQKAN